jgi:hypothetical protein
MNLNDRRLVCSLVVSLLWLSGQGVAARADEKEGMARFRDEVQPVLEDYCYGCHGTGLKKGGVTLDEFPSDEALLGSRNLWWGVLKNVRAGLMPPAGKPRPSGDEVRVLEDWIKRSVFAIDPNDPDPGRVTLRRLNRIEYRNTIHDLMGVDFRADLEFPPDDTGYGFDTIGDVLTISPLLLEKYMQAAGAIVTEAVPTVSRVVAARTIPGGSFRGPDGGGEKMTFYKPARVTHELNAEKAGHYRLFLELQVRGAFVFDPGKCRLTFRAGGKELLAQEFAWQDGRTSRFEFTEDWNPGPHPLDFTLEPLTPVEKKVSNVDMRIVSVRVEGPLEKEHWERPKNFDRFFTRDDPGTSQGRKAYAREVIQAFATKAYRRPVDEGTLGRLLAIAEATYAQAGKSVEDGMARAMIAVLSSPRFLFRVEGTEPNAPAKGHPLLDEYALAARLSYFLWSTMPDDELFRLARRGELRENLGAQVKRMMADPRSNMFVENFTGQWLQTRDVESVPVDARVVLARDDGEEKELKREQADFREFLAQRQAEAKKQAQAQAKTKQDAQKAQQAFGQLRRSGRFRLIFGTPKADLDFELRQAMRRETQMFFAAVAREDRSVLDLLDCDFTFLNARLAKHYGIPDVKGDEMRKVVLPKDSPRGGLLTQASVLVVTSNPTRTSPVKRGLFILDNMLGTPAPPPPPDVPQLEESEKGFTDREPTLREVLDLHRSKPLCSACHARMDPLGLALENFNALGMWREKERGQPLDTGGKLTTGETFEGVRALKRVLKEEHRLDFYRCLTEKLLTYALGRGLEDYDIEPVDRIVERLDAEGGRFSALLMGVIESVPFQKRRSASAPVPPSGGPEKNALTGTQEP